MDKVLRTAVTAAAAIAIAALSLTLPAQAGPRSAVGAGLVGFGIGAILGSMMGPPEVYFVPPPPRYYGPVVYGPPNYDGPVAYRPPDYYRPRNYGPPSSYRPRSYGPPPPAPDRTENRIYPGPKAPSAGDQERRPTPVRSATAKTGPAAVTPVKQDPNAKFKAVQAKAKRVGVEQLTQKDIEGLSFEQIKQLRGY
jgi:hypothetical protein